MKSSWIFLSAISAMSFLAVPAYSFDSGSTVYLDNQATVECPARVRLFNVKEGGSRGFGAFNASGDECASGRLRSIELQTFTELKTKTDNKSLIKLQIIENALGSCDFVMDGSWSANGSGSGAFLWCIKNTGKFQGVYWLGKLKVQFDGVWNGTLRD